MTAAISGFFTPNPFAFFGNPIPVTQTAFYSTHPLEATLNELVDFALFQGGTPRLTIGAANVRTSEMRYFDSRNTRLSARHIMASGALPPAFPAVRIEGELFWDGGLLSNTPLEAVFDENPGCDSLIFGVAIWSQSGPEPETIWQVLDRQKEVQYASRTVSHIQRQKEIQHLRRIIAELASRLPDAERETGCVREMTDYRCVRRMHVIRLHAPRLEGEDFLKDIDFNIAAIRSRWDADHEICSRRSPKRRGKATLIRSKVCIFTKFNRGEPSIMNRALPGFRPCGWRGA